MPVTPGGPLWTAFLLEITLADVQAWRDLVGAVDRDEARKFIYYPWMLNPDQNEAPNTAQPNHGLPPRAIISDDADIAPYRRYQKSLGSFVGEDNSLMLSFDLPVPDVTYEEAPVPKNAGYWFADQVGKIMSGLEDLAAGRGPAVSPDPDISDCSYFNMQSYSKMDGPFELDPTEYTYEWLRDGTVPRYVFHMSWIVEHR